MSVYEGCLTNTRLEILGLNLDGIDDSNLIIRTVALQKDIQGDAQFPGKTKLPGIIIAPFARESVIVATNDKDDIGYGVLVAIVDKETKISIRTAVIISIGPKNK